MSARGGGYRYAFHDGRWLDAGAATIGMASLGMRYALSVFEGLRLYRGSDGVVRPFRLDEHLRRLADSLVLTRLPMPAGVELADVITELSRRNNVHEDAYVRIAVSAGNPGLMGDEAYPLLTVTVTKMGRKRWLAANEGMRLQISGWQRAAEESFPAAAKNISGYAGPRLALLAARDAGYDSCVLTNRHGRLAEAPTAALVVIRDGVLSTPSLSEGVLPSITRRWALDTAAELGISVVEGPVGRTDAYLADEAFLCGTGIEIAPVRSFDHVSCRCWPAAPMTRTLIQRYFQDARAIPAAAGRRAA